MWSDVLGEEILYWSCKQLDADGEAGTYPRSVGDVLRDSGQSASALWPYDQHRNETASDYAPPPAAREADQMRRATLRTISHRLDELRVRVDAGHAVLLGLELWPGFFSAPDGALGTPAPLELIGEAHAVALVAYDDGPQELLLRNSWGRTWGREGHGRLPYGALPIVARGTWILDDDLDG